jgi:flagellar hook protein FlgE
MSILNSAVSGMLANSNWLSNISQNVANSNSTGYKDIDTDFSALVDQSPGQASAGAGVASSSQSLNAAQGQIETTTTTTDLAIQGPPETHFSPATARSFQTRRAISSTPPAII